MFNILFDKYECEQYGFNPFILTEIISIKDTYSSIFIFESRRK